jgi:hypothetical protein
VTPDVLSLEGLFTTATSHGSLANMVAFTLAPQQARIAELKAARAQRDAEASPPVRLFRYGPSRGTR